MKLFNILNRAITAPTIVQVPTSATASYEPGVALKLSSGKAVLCAGTSKPEFVCSEKKDVTGATTLSAYAVDADTLYEVELAEEGALTVGAKYTLSTNGKTITTTTTNGVAEVVSVTGSAIGDKAVIRFN